MPECDPHFPPPSSSRSLLHFQDFFPRFDQEFKYSTSKSPTHVMVFMWLSLPPLDPLIAKVQWTGLLESSRPNHSSTSTCPLYKSWNPLPCGMCSVQMIVPIFLPVQKFWLISWAIVHFFAEDSEILPHPGWACPNSWTAPYWAQWSSADRFHYT